MFLFKKIFNTILFTELYLKKKAQPLKQSNTKVFLWIVGHLEHLRITNNRLKIP